LIIRAVGTGFWSGCAEVRERRIFDWRYVAVTGIVNEDVQATKGLNRGIYCAVGLRFFRDVD
jgi:hypothetical protein